MLAETAERPFSRAGWLFEPKLDGYRVLAARRAATPRLLTRNGNDCTERVSRGGARGGGAPVRPRAARRRGGDPRRTRDGPASSGCRDGPASGGRSTSATPRSRRRSPSTRSTCSASRTSICARCRSPTRKAVLQRVLPPAGALRYLDHVEEDGEALYHEAERLGLEGIVAKKADAPYKAGRSAVWLKMRSRKTDDFVVVGFTAPKGSRGGFGALHLARVRGGDADLRRPGRQRLQRQAARRGEPETAGRSGARLRRAAGRCRRRRGRPGSSRSWCARSSTPSGPTRGCCGSRCSCGSGTTSSRRSACGSGGEGAAVSASAARGETTERRGTLPRRSSRRGPTGKVPAPLGMRRRPLARKQRELPFELTNLKKVFWPDERLHQGRPDRRTTARSRRGCCRTSRTGRWC